MAFFAYDPILTPSRNLGSKNFAEIRISQYLILKIKNYEI